ncbi:MAG: tetratricopeptide repeat protein, partial [Rhodospirillales bacterium]|nr:tetratricopeptide repeat protein [Rhodospirillales bacterium]
MGVTDIIDSPPGASTASLLARTAEFLKGGRLDAAESLCREILNRDSVNLEALKYLGLIAYQTGNAAAAIKIFRRVHGIDPSNAEILYHLGNARFADGEPGSAADLYRRAIEVSPAFLAAHVNLANTLLHSGDLESAERASIDALALAPDNPEALSNLGQILLKAGRLTEAVDNLTRALGPARDKPAALTNLGAAQQTAGNVDAAIDSFRRALAMDPNCHLAERNLLIAMLNQPDLTAAERFELHRRHAAKHLKPAARRVSFADSNRAPKRRLKIGYVSSDFRDHPVARNLLPLIRNHDRAAFEIFLYAEEEFDDQVSAEFRALADHWISTRGINDAQLAARMRQDRIDVLVFLAGRFNLNRPLIAAHRAAPVQVSFHDCATSGLDEMDYWLSDGLLHPAETQEKFTEQLYRLPEFYQFTPPPDVPAATPPPSAENGYITFGCFNKPEKINATVIALWGEILRATPASRLALKYRNYYGDAGIAGTWRDHFERLGLDQERLILLSGDDPLDDHLRAYGKVDIALDPFPFNGATTTFEALLMGVPVIALWGDGFVDRVAASMLTHIGRGELAAGSQRAYLDIA